MNLILLALLQAAAPAAVERGGLPRFARVMERARAGEKNGKGDAFVPRVIYLGSAASTAPAGYRPAFTRRLKELHPGAPLLETNAGLAGSGSWLAAFRAKSDLMDHWLYADLVVVELSAGDAAEPPARAAAAVEGVVRQIRRRYPLSDLVFLHFPGGPVEAHERVAEHYGIPSLRAADDAAALAGLEGLLARSKPGAEKPASPAPLAPEAMERAQVVPYEKAAFDAGWLGWQFSASPRFLHVLEGATPGAVASIRFKGRACGWYGLTGPDAGDVEVSVDGGPWSPQPGLKDPPRPRGFLAADGLDPAKEHELRVRVVSGRVRLAGFLVDGDPVWEDPYKGLDPLARVDEVYRGIPPLRGEAPAGRHAALPRTMERLRSGPSLTIVMLGDSIVNDTSSSRWELMLGRLYPKCAVKKVTSVRGSTGCWWYKEPGRVQEWVLVHQPDLLMIGGISQRDDVDSIRSVVSQVRAARPETELLLMTGAFGTYDPVGDKDFAPSVPADGPSYRSRLSKLAQDEKAAFIDFAGIWGTYLRECGRPRLWYMRDPVHANERGFQVLGRILERWFAPPQ